MFTQARANLQITLGEGNWYRLDCLSLLNITLSIELILLNMYIIHSVLLFMSPGLKLVGK